MILNENGKPKYPQLFSLAKSILSLSHGNVVPEKGFSINKYMFLSMATQFKETRLLPFDLLKISFAWLKGYQSLR